MKHFGKNTPFLRHGGGAQEAPESLRGGRGASQDASNPVEKRVKRSSFTQQRVVRPEWEPGPYTNKTYENRRGEQPPHCPETLEAKRRGSPDLSRIPRAPRSGLHTENNARPRFQHSAPARVKSGSLTASPEPRPFIRHFGGRGVFKQNLTRGRPGAGMRQASEGED